MSIELNCGATSTAAGQARAWRPALPAALIVLALELDARRNPRAGIVHLGAVQWPFANRVQLLEAIDAAFEQARTTRAVSADDHRLYE